MEVTFPRAAFLVLCRSICSWKGVGNRELWLWLSGAPNTHSHPAKASGLGVGERLRGHPTTPAIHMSFLMQAPTLCLLCCMQPWPGELVWGKIAGFTPRMAPGSFPRAFLCLISGSASNECLGSNQCTQLGSLAAGERVPCITGGFERARWDAAGVRGGKFFRGLTDDSDSLEQPYLRTMHRGGKHWRARAGFRLLWVFSPEGKNNFLPVLMMSGNYLPPSDETRGDVMGGGKKRKLESW